jgi:hypothetical protein
MRSVYQFRYRSLQKGALGEKKVQWLQKRAAVSVRRFLGVVQGDRNLEDSATTSSIVPKTRQIFDLTLGSVHEGMSLIELGRKSSPFGR